MVMVFSISSPATSTTRSVTVLSNQINPVRAGFAFDAMAIPVAASLVSDSRLAAADFNRDGRLDIVSRGGSRPGDGDGVVVALTGHADVLLPGPNPFAGFAVADFTRDGNPDVLYIAGGSANLGDPHAFHILGNGRGAFSAAPLTGSPLSLRKCAAGDLNRDARAGSGVRRLRRRDRRTDPHRPGRQGRRDVPQRHEYRPFRSRHRRAARRPQPRWCARRSRSPVERGDLAGEWNRRAVTRRRRRPRGGLLSAVSAPGRREPRRTRGPHRHREQRRAHREPREPPPGLRRRR